MFQVNYLNKISPKGTALWTENYRQSQTVEEADALVVRSAALHDMAFSDNLMAIARAGAGVNNIPLDRCSEAGIVVFNTPGANANAVKELVLCAMLMGSRDVDGGIQWVRQQVASAACFWAAVTL
jgi:D-3-phosphoglycerate dehydrogenase